MKITEIINHETCRSIIVACKENDIKNGWFKIEIEFAKEKLSELEIYIYDVGLRMINLCDFGLKLHQSLIKIKAIPNKRFLSKHEVSEFDHVMLSHEDYLIRLNSIESRAIQLVNSVFDLGWDSGTLHLNLIIKNNKISNTKIPSILKKIQRIIKPYEKQRNSLVHRESLYDPRAKLITEMSIISRFVEIKEENESTNKACSRLLTHHINEYIKNITNEYNVVNQNIADCLDDLLKEINYHYEIVKSKKNDMRI